jgi:peptidyl-prolyl cis-trans isomerase D
MLNFIRDKAQGWIAWFIVGLISIPFALWGVNSYLTGGSDVVVAEVNGNDITQNDLQQSLQQYRDRMRNVLGDQFDPSMFEGPVAKRNVLDALIEEKLITEAATSLKQSVSDQQVAAVIRNIPAFQRDGQFDNEVYTMLLARMGYSPNQYETRLRFDLMSQQLTDNVTATSVVAPYQIDQALRLEKQQRELAYGMVSLQKYAEETEVDDADVKAYFDANTADYTAPEQMKLDYLQLSLDAIASGLTASEEDIKQYYADNQSRFVGPEQRRASHILIEGDDDEALAKAQALKAQLDNGEDFAELAKTQSQDPGSASQGGDLGFFGHDVMDPAFEEAAFALANVGDVSEPVKTEFGYHLIKLTAIQQDESKPFAEVQAEVEKQYRREQAESQFYDKAEQLANLTYENPDNLEPAAEALELDIQSTPSFTRTGTETGISSEDKVISAAFSEDVKDEGLNSAVIELSDTDVVVIRKNKYIPETVLPYESVEPAIKQQLLFDAASKQAKDKGEQLLADLQAGEAVTADFDQWTDAAFYDRESEAVSKQILRRAFSMPSPANDKAVYQGFTAENGNYIVIKLSALKDGDTSAVTQDERDVLIDDLKNLYSRAEFDAFMATLRAEADIEINDAALQ